MRVSFFLVRLDVQAEDEEGSCDTHISAALVRCSTPEA